MKKVSLLLILCIALSGVCAAQDLTDSNVLHFAMGGMIAGMAKTYAPAAAIIWGVGLGTLVLEAAFTGPVDKGSEAARTVQTDVWGALIGAAIVSMF